MNRTGEALCAALRDGPALGSQIDLAALTPAQWHDVAALAIRQRVGPLLYSRSGLPIPDDVRARLRARADISVRRVLMQQAAFRELAAAVEPLGISLIALKGLHLATSVYPSAGLREMNDVDVLVHPDHVEAASDAVRSLGYRSMGDIPVQIALKAMHHVPRFLRGSVGLELHWRLAPPGEAPLVEPNELLTMVMPSALAGNAHALNPEPLLVHVCAHAGTHHLEQGVRPLCDVQAIVSRSAGALAWPLVVDLARQWNCERSVVLVLSLARNALAVDVPDEVLDALSAVPPSPDVLRLAMIQALSETGEIYETSSAAGALLATPGARAKLRHLRDRVWLPDDLMATLYPDAGTHRLARAGVAARRVSDLIRRYLWSLLRLISRRNSSARAALDRRNVIIAWLRNR